MRYPAPPARTPVVRLERIPPVFQGRPRGRGMNRATAARRPLRHSGARGAFSFVASGALTSPQWNQLLTRVAAISDAQHPVKPSSSAIADPRSHRAARPRIGGARPASVHKPLEAQQDEGARLSDRSLTRCARERRSTGAATRATTGRGPAPRTPRTGRSGTWLGCS